MAGLAIGNWLFEVVLGVEFAVLRLNSGARRFVLFWRDVGTGAEIVLKLVDEAKPQVQAGSLAFMLNVQVMKERGL